MAFAGNNQRGDPIRNAWASRASIAPDLARAIRTSCAFRIWQVHYGLRPQVPDVLLGTFIEGATYGIYRPALENHVYRDLTIADVTSEPFNRGMDDASTQLGRLTVDGLTFARFPQNRQIPLIQISDNNPTGEAESHFRNVRLVERKDASRRALVDRGGGARVAPITEAGVPVYLHDHYGPGRTAKVASTSAAALMSDGTAWRKEAPLTGDDSVVAEVRDVPFPQLLDPVDDLAPATIITAARFHDGKWTVTGITHDNGDITAVTVNGQARRSSR